MIHVPTVDPFPLPTYVSQHGPRPTEADGHVFQGLSDRLLERDLPSVVLG
jgi:hypothetical protein